MSRNVILIRPSVCMKVFRHCFSSTTGQISFKLCRYFIHQARDMHIVYLSCSVLSYQSLNVQVNKFVCAISKQLLARFHSFATDDLVTKPTRCAPNALHIVICWHLVELRPFMQEATLYAVLLRNYLLYFSQHLQMSSLPSLVLHIIYTFWSVYIYYSYGPLMFHIQLYKEQVCLLYFSATIRCISFKLCFSLSCILVL